MRVKISSIPPHLIEPGHYEVNADGDPDLGAHGVLSGVEEGMNPQVLLDPFEEQFDLPLALVNCCDSQSLQFEVISQEDEPLSGPDIGVADTSESLRVAELPFRVCMCGRSGQMAG